MSEPSTVPLDASVSRKLTKKQRRKQAQRRQLITFATIVVLVLVVAGVVLGIQHFRSSSEDIAPGDVRLSASTATGEVEISPYSVCSYDATDCGGDQPTPVTLPADGEITVKIPSEVADHDWKLVQIFDDPGANSVRSYAANEATEVTLKGSADRTDASGTRPRLTVVEFQSILIDSSGDAEEPVAAVWSISPAEH